jgi:hypothetical protein
MWVVIHVSGEQIFSVTGPFATRAEAREARRDLIEVLGPTIKHVITRLHTPNYSVRRPT